MTINLSDPLTVLILGFIASLIAAVIFVFIKGLLKGALKPWFRMFALSKRRKKEKTGLETYRQTLEDRTLRISHPWMKEEQTLTDILVPINFQTKKATQREELEVYLAREFKKNQSLRLLILGKPGSGKTIAMRVIARTLWTIDKEIQLVPVIEKFSDIKGIEKTRTSLRFEKGIQAVVPVLMNFSDIKGITDKEGLEKKIIENLIYYQFEQGKKDENTAKKFVEENLYRRKLFFYLMAMMNWTNPQGRMLQNY